MIILIIVTTLIVLFFAVNYRARKTNAYKNFYRSIHVVKDVPKGKKYSVGAFGSTFSYYAFDLKKYNGHNFSVEPQSIRYMEKTIRHFSNNIEKGGIALIALTGCFFAAASTTSDEECLTYQAFLNPDEFDTYYAKVKIKYYLKRYLPALSPYYVKCIFQDEPLKYSVDTGLSYDKAVQQAKNRLRGWERVVGKRINVGFTVDKELQKKIDLNIEAMKKIIEYLREKEIIPVFVILPMSKAFNTVCPREFYNEILYKSVKSLSKEEVKTLDFLYDENMGIETNYYIADCLNVNGRKLFTEKLMKEINSSMC